MRLWPRLSTNGPFKRCIFTHRGATLDQKLPAVEDFRSVCRGQTVDMLKWIVGNVHSAETVKKVKGNLELKARTKSTQYKVKYGGAEKFEQEKTDLLDRRVQLTRELTALLGEIGHLEKDVERLNADIIKTENEYQKFSTSIGDVRRKAALLDASSGQCKMTLAEYEEYTRRIVGRVDAVESCAKKDRESEVFYSRKTSPDIEHTDTSPSLETACSKSVRESCDSIGSFLHQVLQGSFGSNKGEFSKRKEQLWNQLENVMNEYSSQQIAQALMSNTQEASFTVRELTSKIDIRRDAERLRFKFEHSGDLKDLSTPPSLMKSVHELLLEREKVHVRRFMETEKHKNDAWKLEGRLQEVREQIDKRLQKTFAQKSADLQLARQMVETDMEVLGSRAVLHCLSAESDHLKDTFAKSSEDKKVLLTKYQRIQDFQDIVDKKQNLIRVLVKQNTNAQSRLDAQRHEIEDYTKKSLTVHHKEVKTITNSLRGSVTTEIDAFANLLLPYLMFSSIDSTLKTAVMDMSINHTNPSYIRPVLLNVLESLQFPQFSAPEEILPRCMHLKSDIEEMVSRQSVYNAANQQFIKEGDKDVITVITELCLAVSELENSQMKKSQALIQQKINKTAKALTDCLKVKDAFTAWWEQPGQSCVPWLTVDNHTLQYWTDRWTVWVTKLRQSSAN